MTYVGKRIEGRNNRLSVAGAGTYVDDVKPEKCLVMVVVRSTEPHALISSIDTSAAEQSKGVLLVVTGAQLAEAGVSVPPAVLSGPFIPRTATRYPLANGKVRHFGEGVAAVIATDLVTARAAADLVVVKYEKLPAVANADEALAPGAPIVEPTWPDNLLAEWPFTVGDPERILANATVDGRSTGVLTMKRIQANPMETRGMVASFDPHRGHLTCWASTQSPHILRSMLAGVLRLPESSVRVVQPQVGGAFGAKIPMAPEDVLTAWTSLQLGRPVKWIEQRHEYLIAGGHSRDVSCSYRIAFEPDGRITALEVDMLADVGAPSTLAGWLMAEISASMIPGSYKIHNVSVRLRVAVSNRGPWQAYRGYGKEVSSFFMERILDDVARCTGRGRDEVRLRNFIAKDEFPYVQPSGWVTDSGDYAGTLHDVKKLIGWDQFPARKAEARAAGRFLGMGIGHELTPDGAARPDSLMSGTDSATVRISPHGDVTVLTGVTSPGTGNETGIAQMVADALGARIERVRVMQGDTDSSPYGNGNYSSRSLTFGGSSAVLAVQPIREKLTLVGSRMLRVPVETMEIVDHRLSSPDCDRDLSIDEVAWEIYRRPHGVTMEGIEPHLESTRSYRSGNVHHQSEVDGKANIYPTWSFSTSACVVEVDPQTGVVTIEKFAIVHDSGKIVNPLLAEAQMHGAVLQGIGASLYEEIVYDSNAYPVHQTLREYTLPSARESVELLLGHRTTLSPFTMMGMKGVGESGISAPAGAIASAIEDALIDWDARMTTVPFTPARVWQSIQDSPAQPAW
jgi:carbon-monoxide dehydrogenase large subunit